jgi:hypothetical protein
MKRKSSTVLLSRPRCFFLEQNSQVRVALVTEMLSQMRNAKEIFKKIRRNHEKENIKFDRLSSDRSVQGEVIVQLKEKFT